MTATVIVRCVTPSFTGEKVFKKEKRAMKPAERERSPVHPRTLWDIDRIFDEMRKEFEEPSWWTGRPLFGRILPRAWGLAETWRSPRVDLRETAAAYEVTAELPGIPKEKVEISTAEGRLEIRADGDQEKEEKKEGYYYREIGKTSFFRSIPMPEDADLEKAEAKMENGCLTVTVPRKAGAPKRKLQVK